MIIKPDLSIEEVREPYGRWCCSGHVAPETFRRDGANSAPLPTRFFRVTNEKIDGVYCEPCMVISQAMARQTRKTANGKRQ